MRLLIILIFILAGVAIYLFRHFEKKRSERMENDHEKKRESFQKLLESVRKESNKKNNGK